MTRSVRLRPWQKRALDQLAGSARPDFLAVATPGAGKTTFALTAVRQRLALDPRPRVVVVAPTAHLKRQWAEAAARFDLHLEHQWSPLDGALPADVRGVVTTYQQVASAAPALAAIARDGLVVFDELHHAGDDRAWGDGVRAAFAGASWRLALSGTPFRSDTRAIPFVDYVLDEARPDYEYGYGEALADANVVRPVEFPRLNGHMEWVSPDGTVRSAAFDDALDQTLAAQRLRTALSLEGEWLPAVLDAAHAKLLAVRAEQPDAGGLVIATDREHARGISRLLRERHGVHAVVATSEDAEASDRIARFARQHRTLDRGRADGVGGGRHPPAAGRRVRHHDHHRAVLPAGRGPARALDPWRGPPARLPLHPRRRPAPGPGPAGRRPAPAQPAA